MEIAENTSAQGFRQRSFRFFTLLSQSKWFFAGLLVAVMGLYASVYFSNTFPFTEGWNVNIAEMVLQGKLPYRDFYYYLPPLNVALDVVFWLLSFGSLFVYRLWWLAQRITIFVLIYFLLCKYFKPACAFLSCAFGSILATASLYDLFGDYNQTSSLLIVLLLYAMVGFSEATVQKKKYTRAGVAGMMLALILLNKQPIFLASCMLFFLTLTLLCALRRDKQYKWYLLSVACGVLAVMLPVIIAMLATGTLRPFVEQVFLRTGGKASSLFDMIVVRLFGHLTQLLPLVLVALVTLALKLDRKGKANSAVLVLMVLAGAFVTFYRTGVESILGSLQLENTLRFQAVLVFGAIPLMTVTGLCLCERGPKLLRSRQAVLISTAFWCVAILLGGYLTDTFYADPEERGLVLGYLFNSSEATFSLVNHLLYTVVFYFALVLFVLYLTRAAKKGEARVTSLTWISCGALALIYAGIMASGQEIPYYGMFLAIPLVLCHALSLVMRDKVLETVLRTGTMLACAVLCLVCLSQKYINAYAWWGNGIVASAQYKTYETDIPALRGFTFPEAARNDLEAIYDVILANSDEDDVIYGFPHLKLFNVLTGRYNQDTFVPVMFYDVVDDYYVQQENELLAQHLPDILIIYDMPTCMSAHEGSFRDGKPLEQRKTLALFEAAIAEGKYTLLGTYAERYGEKICVYKLNEAPPAQ